jgi:diguanylate cyclase (GGDEF)-like protein/PAS domain S-box-containing protein
MASAAPSTPDQDREQERLAALYSLDILDTPEEPEYDELVRLAATICGTPISAFTLVDADRQWFKAITGLPVHETPRSVSFCSHTIQQPGLFLVENAAEDPRFRDNPVVVDDPGIRFYAGVPLEANGQPIGAFCVIDTVPRTLTAAQKEALQILGRQVTARIELRARERSLEAALKANEQLTARLERLNQLFRTFVEKNPAACYFKSEDGKYIAYNTRFAEFFHISETEWVGKTVDDVFPPDVASTFKAQDREALAQDGALESVGSYKVPTGAILWYKSVRFPVRTSEGVRVLACIVIDITLEVERENALAEANSRLEILATTDSLTSLYNRRFYDQRIASDFATARRASLPLAILMIDIDNFKLRNDTFGHHAGDDALRILAAVMRQTVRAGDLAARIGGEEFSIILTATDSTAAAAFAARLQSLLRDTDFGSAGPLTISIGIACLQSSIRDWPQLCEHADQALYAAKRAGKNRFELYSQIDPSATDAE